MDSYDSLMKSITMSEPLPIIINLDPNLKCPKCKALMTDATQTPCGHIYCGQCLHDIIDKEKDRAYCPANEEDCFVDVLTKDNIVPDNRVRKQIRNLNVQCTYQSRGCKEIVKWSKLETHKQQCPYAEFDCSNKRFGCQVKLTPDSKDTHLKTECQYRRIYCKYCEESIMAKDEKNHLKNRCQRYPVYCPYNCSFDKPIERRQLNMHFKNCKGKPRNHGSQHYESAFKGQTEYQLELKSKLEDNDKLIKDYEDRIKSLKEEVNEQQKLYKSQSELVARVQGVSASAIEKNLSITTKISDNKKRLEKCVNNEEFEKLQQTLKAVESSVKACAADNNRGSDGHSLTTLFSRLGMLEDKINKTSKSFTDFKDCSFNGIFIWKIDRYTERKRSAINGENVSIYSSPFQVGRFGYKMRARVYLNGDGKGKGSHISFFITICKGDYDDILKWPYQQKTTMMMLDLSGKGKHIVEHFIPHDNNDCFKKPETQTNLSSGTPLFALHSKIEANNSVFKRNDTIYLKVVVDLKDLKEFL